MPPAVEDALVAQEVVTEDLSEAAREGGISENNTTGLADSVESAGEISPEQDPTTSYRGAEDRQEETREQANGPGDPVADANTANEPDDVHEAGRASSGDAEGVPGGGEDIPGELGDSEAESGVAPSSQAAPEPKRSGKAEASEDLKEPSADQEPVGE